MIFRTMTMDDISDVAKVFVSAYAGSPWNEQWEYDKAFLRIKQIFETKNSICLVCQYENQIVGAILCLLIPWTAGYQLDVRDFFIAGDYQNMSFGTKLIEYLPQVLPQNEKIEIVLSTQRHPKLIHFYEKNGFVCNRDFIFYSKFL